MVRVKPGYARNYLLPHGLAYEATEGNKKRIAAETKARGVPRPGREGRGAAGSPATLGGVTLTLSGKAGEEGKLFGSITAQDIADGPGARRVTRSTSGGSSWSIRSRRSVSTPSPIRLHPEVHAERARLGRRGVTPRR